MNKIQTAANATNKDKYVVGQGSEIVALSGYIHLLYNPFMPNGTPQGYQLDLSISILLVVGCYFSFYPNFDRIFR